uniref:Uncharacterized protein n=1 Tax=Anopheles coluzzii TaxID=1518534 RepID=A0A8W7Q3P5_ANOCL
MVAIGSVKRPKSTAEKTSTTTNLHPTGLTPTSSIGSSNLSPSSTAILHHGTTMVTVKSSPGGSGGTIATAASPTSLILTTVGRAETASGGFGGSSSSASSSPSAAASPVSLSGLAKKPRPKTVSPTRHGPQQCQHTALL